MDHVGLVNIGCDPIKFDDIPLRDDHVFNPIHSHNSMSDISLCRDTRLCTTQQNIILERSKYLHNSEPVLGKHKSPEPEKIIIIYIMMWDYRHGSHTVKILNIDVINLLCYAFKNIKLF